MKDEHDIDTRKTAKDAAGERDAPQIAEDDKPAVSNLLKAAKDGAKNLRNLKP
jgi:hypothetical protein